MPLRLAAWLTLAALAPAAAAGRTPRSPEAVALEAAFAHDLCTRDDRALRALNRALTRGPPVRAGHGRTSPKP